MPKTKILEHKYLYTLFFLIDKYKEKGYKVYGNLEKKGNKHYCKITKI